jgi:hypothetical protein
MQNYDKFQRIWLQNLEKHEKVRNRLNDPTYSKTHMANRRQSNSMLGDITVQDRVDSTIEEKRNKDLFEVSIKPNIDHGVHWQNQLRKNEPDVEREGVDCMVLSKTEVS